MCLVMIYLVDFVVYVFEAVAGLIFCTVLFHVCFDFRDCLDIWIFKERV